MHTEYRIPALRVLWNQQVRVASAKKIEQVVRRERASYRNSLPNSDLIPTNTLVNGLRLCPAWD